MSLLFIEVGLSYDLRAAALLCLPELTHPLLSTAQFPSVHSQPLTLHPFYNVTWLEARNIAVTLASLTWQYTFTVPQGLAALSFSLGNNVLKGLWLTYPPTH